MKSFLIVGLLFLMAALTSNVEAQVARNRNDLKFLNAATGKDTNTVYTTAVDNADLSLGGVYVDGVIISGTTDKVSGTVSAAVKIQERLNPSAGWTDIANATYSITNVTSQSFTIKLAAGYYNDLRTVITGSTGLHTTKVWAAPWVVKR